jgi:glycyl-tRNA synthetase beta subunit
MNKCIHSFQNEKKVNQLIIELKKLGKDIEKYFLKNLIKIEGKLIKTNRNVLSS